jgi:uncharacterized protein YqgC (DUF456 family)
VDFWLYYTLALLLVCGGGLCWLSNLFSLPGNWILLGLAALFAWLAPHASGRGIGWTTVGVLAGLAVLGEVIEFFAGAAGAAKQGASRRSIVFSLIGGMAGSIFGAMAGLPVPVIGSVIAALLGGSLGAFAGAYVGEKSIERPHSESMAVARGAFAGRLWGTVGKFAVGAVMLGVMTVDVLFG